MDTRGVLSEIRVANTEGLRIAALAKQGSAGIYLFGDPEPKKSKKFSYKRKAQKFPLRRVEGTEANPPPKPAKRTSVLRQNEASGNKNAENSENAETEKKKPAVDFIKKNAMSVRKGKETKNSKKDASQKDNGGKKYSDTVTLTKEQLQAILSAIGTSAQLEAAMAMKEGSKAGESGEKERPVTKQEETRGEEEVNKASGRETAKPEKINVREDVAVTKDTGAVPEERRSRMAESRAEKLQQIMASDDKAHTVGMGNIGMTGYNDRSLAEKKREQWKQELAEQVALKRQDQETRKSWKKTQENQMQESFHEWDPFGKSGGGAPNKNYAMTATEQKPPIPQPRHTVEPTREPVERTAPSRAQPSPDKVPAAMRSSFVLGEGSPREHQHSATKRQERQQWLEELEKQRQEIRNKKDRERRERQQGFQETWADQFDTIRGQPQNPRYQSVGPKQVVDDASIKTKMTHTEPELNAARDFENQSKSAPQTADPGYDIPVKLSIANPNNAASEIIHARGKGHQLLMDPTEKERLEKARQKQLEHQMAIKAQVEEKLKKKREEEEKMRREEMVEERRLALERAELQSKFNQDQQKQRQKEEEVDRKTRALMMSMQLAQEQAAQEKHARRMQHLIDGGHDVRHLKKSWDVHHSPDVTPRGMVFPAEQFSPRSGVVDPSILSHQGQGEDFRSIHRTEEPLSPVKDEAIQTEFQYSNQNGLPPNLERIAREDSAGVEFKFKPVGKPQNKADRSDNTERGRGRVKEVKSRKVTRSPSPEAEKTKQRYKKLSERPQWGKPSVNRKKVKKASEKDLTLDRAKKEERLRKRQQELLLLQELNAPERLVARERSASPPVPAIRSRIRTMSPDGQLSRRQGYNSSVGGRTTRHRSHSPEGRRTKQYSRAAVDSPPLQPPESPPLKTGEFAPFLRSEALELNPDSVPQTPEQYKKQKRHRQRRRSIESNEDRPVRKEKKPDHEMDPLLNPDRLKDKEHRQEMILKQLSHLRQGLIMKQRELEVGLTPFNHQ